MAIANRTYEIVLKLSLEEAKYIMAVFQNSPSDSFHSESESESKIRSEIYYELSSQISDLL